MVFFDRTSTQMLSMIGAVYGVFIYSISFSLEMWFIVTSPVLPAATSSNQFNPMDNPPNRVRDQDGQEEAMASVPLLAFVLAALYFVTVMVSLLLILGIIIRSLMCVLTWIITIVLLLLPEVSLVLFMTVYTWVCMQLITYSENKFNTDLTPYFSCNDRVSRQETAKLNCASTSSVEY